MRREKGMTSISELKPVLEKYGYKLVKLTRFKKTDRLKIEAKFGFLTVNYRKHIEDYTLKEVCDGLLTEGQFMKEFGVSKA